MYDLGTNIGAYKRYDTETNATIRKKTECNDSI